MIRGFDFLPKMLDGLTAYMKEMGYSKIRDFRDLLLGNIKSASDLTIRKGHAFINKEVCTRCGLCWKIGHCCAISHDADGVTTVDPEQCLACATCIDVCPSRAISMKEIK